MKYIIVILLLFCNGLLKSQDEGIELPNHLAYFVYERPKDEINKKLNEIENYSLEDLSSISKWQYHLAVSSYKLYLDKDSSLYHFNEANKIEPFATCRTLRVRHNTFIKLIEEGKESGVEHAYIKVIKEEKGDSLFSWYLWDLPDFDENGFIDSCNQKYAPKKEEPIVKDSTRNSEIIKRRDQKYRSIDKLKEQQELDQLNRDFVDSLYLLKGSLNAFDEEEIYQFSMVTHHSEDCDWAYKWIERLIDHSMSGYEGKILIGPLLKRMLNAKDGYCTKQDTQKRDYFIYMIKNKYPEFVEKSQLNW